MKAWVSSRRWGRRGRPAARRRSKRCTFSVTRSASNGTAIAGVLPTCGVMMQFGSDHNGCPSGSGSGSVTSSPAPPIVPFSQRPDQVVGDDVRPPGHVDQPRVVGPSPRGLAASMMPSRLGGHRERQHHGVGAGEHLVQVVDAERAIGAGVGVEAWLRSTVERTPNPPSRRSSDSAIPPPPRIVTLAPSRLRPARRRPTPPTWCAGRRRRRRACRRAAASAPARPPGRRTRPCRTSRCGRRRPGG